MYYSKYFCFTLVLCLLLAGCASLGKNFKEEMINEIVRCKTSESKVRELFGKPYKEGVQSGYKTLKWYYSMATFGYATTKTLIVFINDDGVIVDYALNPTGLVQVMDKCSK